MLGLNTLVLTIKNPRCQALNEMRRQVCEQAAELLLNQSTHEVGI
jgi:hypothetical protein